MMHKYCPNCGSMDFKISGNQIQCNRCKYAGIPKEDSMDVINEFKKKAKSNPSGSFSASSEPNSQNNGTEKKENALFAGKKEELKKKFQNSNDFEFV